MLISLKEIKAESFGEERRQARIEAVGERESEIVLGLSLVKRGMRLHQMMMSAMVTWSPRKNLLPCAQRK